MHRMSVVHLLALVVLVSSQLENKSPSIEQILFGTTGEPEVLDEPQKYIVIGSLSRVDVVTHKFVCVASNADNVYWEYKELVDDPWTTNLPGIVIQKEPKITDSGRVYEQQIDDGDSYKFSDLITLNGFYRCVAKYEAKGYIVQSTPVRLIIPYLVELEDQRPEDVPGEPRINDPFSLPCFKDVSRQLVPEDAADFVDIKFSWKRLIGDNEVNFPENYDPYVNKGRFSVNPKTGELYYAYVLGTDKLEANEDWQGEDLIALLRCEARIDSQDAVLREYQALDPLGARPQQPAPLDVSVYYPTPVKDPDTNKEYIQKSCTSGKLCQVITVFAGEFAERGAVRGRDPSGQVIQPLQDTYQGFQFTAAESAVTQRYTAELFDETDGTLYYELYVNITTINYPRLADRSLFPLSQDLESGTDVEFACQAVFAEDTTFYINGVQVERKGIPSFVSWAGKTEFDIDNVQRENSFSVQCVSENEAGSIYSYSILNVYDKANLVQYPTQDNPYRVEEKSNVTTFTFNCSVTLDVKAKAVDLYWLSNRTDYPNEKVEPNTGGIRSLNTGRYDELTGRIDSTLDLELDAVTQHILSGTVWQCVVEYRILDNLTMLKEDSDPVLFELVKDIVTVSPPEPFTLLPVVIGSAVGFLFLIALIVLINCYMQKNKGEQYYVDEKERKAGHNPEEEMEAYGFSDYTRPSPDYPTNSQTQIGYM